MIPFLIPIISSVVGKVVDGLIANPNVSVTQAEAPAVARQVEKVVRPLIEHLTNNENWWESRVTWGAIFAIMGGTATIGTYIANGVAPSYEDYGPPLLAIWGGLTTVYGRWKARKPLGA